MKVKYLIDVNLPYRLEFWNSEEFLYQYELNDTASDSEIWDFARAKSLTILTKDSDFSQRILISTPPPRIIHFRVGNMKIGEFHNFIKHNWKQITQMSKRYKLVVVRRDIVEGIF